MGTVGFARQTPLGTWASVQPHQITGEIGIRAARPGGGVFARSIQRQQAIQGLHNGNAVFLGELACLAQDQAMVEREQFHAYDGR